MHDVIIIGARAAGASLALALARDGFRVLLVERAEFPSDTMSGHFIQPAGVAALKRPGAGHVLTQAGAPAQWTVTLDFGPVVLSGIPLPATDGTVEGFGPRRHVFDPLLCAAALEAGAEALFGTSFEEPLADGAGRIAGIAARTRDGRRIVLPARLVVGADGKRSRFARAVGAKAYDERPSTTCAYYSYFSGLETPGPRLHVREDLFCIAMPTSDGLTFMAMAWPAGEFRRVKADIDGAFRAAGSMIPWVAERLPVARREERYVGTADLGGFFRVPWGPGWALLGDAGYHKDPITAQGMTDAFLHAEMLAEAVRDGLGGREPLEPALARFHARRDALARPLYELTCELARLAPPPPEMGAALARLVGNAAGISRFLGVMAGTVPAAGMFSPASTEAA